IGDYSRRDVTGIVNVPWPGRDSAVRIVARHTGHDGYGRAYLVDKDLASDDTNYVRAQLQYAPSETWTTNFAYDVTNVQSDSQLITFVEALGDTAKIPGELGNPNDDLSSYVDPPLDAVPDNRAGHFNANVWGTS